MTLDEFKASKKGRAFQPLLDDPNVLSAMEARSRRGEPAVAAVDDLVADRVGTLDDAERQHAGRWVRDVLSARGWRPVRRERVRDGRAFATGAVYAQAAGRVTPGAPVRDFEGARQILMAGRIDPLKPLGTVDEFLAERRAMWGEE